MRVESRYSLIQDWIAIALRWLTLLGLTLSMSARDGVPRAAGFVILAAALYNTGLTLLAAFDRRLPMQRYLVVGVDLLIACLLFFLSGATGGNIGWVIVLPSMTAALYFGLGGGAGVSLAGLFMLGLVTILTSGMLPALIFVTSLVPLCLLVVLGIGYLSQRLQKEILRVDRSGNSIKQAGLLAGPDWQKAVFQMVSALSATLNYQRVLETALDLSANAVGGDDQGGRLVSAVLLYSQNENGNPELHVGSARSFTAADMRISLPGTTGLVGLTIDEGEAQGTSEIASDPELGRIIAFRSCHSSYCIPLRTGFDTYGVLLFAHPKAGFFSPERRDILDMIGKQAIIAIQNARLYSDLEQEKERMMEIQEQARNKLARDLHDGPTQSIAAIAMRVNYARRLMERDSQAAAVELYQVEELARQTTNEIRHMLFTLRPLVLESQGLANALVSMAEKIGNTYNQKVIVTVDQAVVAQLEPSKQGVVFSIAEEAVNNARKHAQAAHIWVRLQLAGEELALLEVEDDGVGFDPDLVNSSYDDRGSLGMINLRERAQLVNGYLKIDSGPGKGTRVSIVIPLTEGAVERTRRVQ